MFNLLKKAFAKKVNEIGLVDAYEVADLNSHHQYTPDLCKLEAFKKVRLFVPDNLQRHCNLHSLLGETEFEAFAFTNEFFHFWKKNALEMSQFIPLETEKNITPIKPTLHTHGSARILGELHLVSPDTVKQLDLLRQNGVQYFRRRIHVLVPNRTVRKTGYHKYERPHADERLNGPVVTDPERVDLQKAFMYIGNPDYWNPLIDAGYSYSSVQQFPAKNRPWLQRYFQFNNHEKQE